MSDPNAIAISAPNTAVNTASRKPASDERAKLAEATKQFEAIFVRQMLAAARQTKFDDGLFDNSSIDTFREMQHSQFADMAAQTGTLGLAKQLEAHLSRFVNGGTSAATPSTTATNPVQKTTKES